MKAVITSSFVVLFLFTLAASAYSGDYPAKPITLMVPWSAGGGTDVGARILAAIAEKKMGQPIVVVNKPGAASQIGCTELARAKPDGYYIGFISLPGINTIILDPDRKAAFTIDSFLPIINQVLDPGLIWVKAESPYKNLKDLLDDAKKRPGEVRASTAGLLGDDHIAIYRLEQAAKVKFRVVHFDGSAQQLTATLGGHVDVSFDNVGSVTPLIKGGKIRGLAVTDKERSRFLPDVPTTVELGYPTALSSSARGVMGPKGIPAPVVKKIQEVFLEAMKDPDHMSKMDRAGLGVKPLVGEEYANFFRSLHDIAKPLVEAYRKEN